MNRQKAGERTDDAPAPQENPEAAARWRDALRDHAREIIQGARGSREGEDTHGVISPDLGPLARDALEIVEAFALGSRELAQSRPIDLNEFSARLQIVLAGIEGELARRQAAVIPEREQPHVIQGELWQVLRKTRESADLAYAREFDLAELDRRILFLLASQGPLVPADVSAGVGVDKAQVSRAVKRLLEMGAIEREQIRAPLRLTDEGKRLSQRLIRLAELRHRELTFDIGEEELEDFVDMIEILLERAVTLYEQERDLAQTAGKNGKTAEPVDHRRVDRVVIERGRIISVLMTLSAYSSRSGALAFRRLTGLSNFEAFVLYEVGKHPPIGWTPLVQALERDHSQAGRTITNLVERGLVEREGRPGRRHGRFFPSQEGSRLWHMIDEAGRERSAFLLAPLDAEQRSRFMRTFDKIRRNAAAQLERERAFAELEN
ncbi:conserved hypothetical protein [Altererythrobacter sp. B11]|uniref:MarR family winged helix-turn-helix transcriptional regulator n=1 Tax=Altererythrobacter sp. B11 TaxID=2060312 RepID=UPI000DC6E6A9|nr:MarR family transcriptional regulator [Altererythrobacter sp. B11]BBC73055.1 conserved hypothetical protein [Altererythrobacter sp. B11]